MGDRYLNALTIISILIFIIMIPLALLNGVYGFIPDILTFIVATLFYRWTYSTFKMNMPIFTMLIIGHILHACGIFGWYYISPVPVQWDHLTHFFGALPYALLFFNWMEQWMDARFFTKKNLLILMAIFFAASGVGAIVELSEFVGYLQYGTGDGAFMFGPGDGIAGKTGSDLIDTIGGGWINEGWDFVYNTFGIIAGMFIMIILRLTRRKEEKAYYFEKPENHSTLTR
jgi:hypothetical protein